MKIKTVDLVILVEGSIALIKRARPPFEEKWVLPGGHVEAGETGIEAALRELEEETGLKVSAEDLWFLCALDGPNRDPRGERVSTVYYLELSSDEWKEARAGSDAREIALHPLYGIRDSEIGFDHWIAIEILRRRHEGARRRKVEDEVGNGKDLP